MGHTGTSKIGNGTYRVQCPHGDEVVHMRHVVQREKRRRVVQRVVGHVATQIPKSCQSIQSMQTPAAVQSMQTMQPEVVQAA